MSSAGSRWGRRTADRTPVKKPTEYGVLVGQLYDDGVIPAGSFDESIGLSIGPRDRMLPDPKTNAIYKHVLWKSWYRKI